MLVNLNPNTYYINSIKQRVKHGELQRDELNIRV